jgi:hypothetical protein
MGIINPTLPSVNSPRGDEEVDARNALATVLGEFNGNVDQNNLKDGAVTKAKLATDALNAFLKLVVAADIKVAFGNYSTGGWGGTSVQTGAIPHGMATTPTVALVAPSAGDVGTLDMSVQVVSIGAANINYQAVSHSGNLSFPGVRIYWVAIG